MKTLFTLTMGMFLLTGFAQAQQQFSNNSFESWDTLGDYTQPSSWYTLNALVEFGFDPSTTITSDAHSGSYAVKLESIHGGFSDLSGVLSTGPILDESFDADFSKIKIAFTGAPEKLEFYYKSAPVSGDSSVLSVVLTRWNVSSQQSDTIASATKWFSAIQNTYTLGSVDFEYTSPLPADSIFLISSSSADGFNPSVGSVLILDDIQLVYGNTGLKQLEIAQPINVYPNPAANQVTIDAEGLEHAQFRIMDYSGKVLLTQSSDQGQINVSNLANGIYFIEIQDEMGRVANRKFVVQH